MRITSKKKAKEEARLWKYVLNAATATIRTIPSAKMYKNGKRDYVVTAYAIDITFDNAALPIVIATVE